MSAIAIAWSITAFHKIKFPELYKLIQFFLSRQKNLGHKFEQIFWNPETPPVKKSEKSFFWCKTLKNSLKRKWRCEISSTFKLLL